MKKEHILTITLLILLWHMMALWVSNGFIVPFPYDVFKLMFYQVFDYKFYISVFNTLKILFVGFSLSFLLALFIGILQDRFIFIRHLFEPIDYFLKSIPNISYIIISLIWLGQRNSAILVCFLVIFPIMYLNICKGLVLKDDNLNNILDLYGKSYLYNLLKVKLPSALSQILIGVEASLSLGFKVLVMAEILNQVHGGIGQNLYNAKVEIDMISIFAWTIWIVIIAMILSKILNYCIKKINKNKMPI